MKIAQTLSCCLLLAHLIILVKTCPVDVKFDVVFCLDWSYKAGTDNYHLITEFVSDIIEPFTIDDSAGRVGLVSSDSKPAIKLQLSGDKYLIHKALDNFRFSDLGVKTTPNLFTSGRMFSMRQPQEQLVKSIVVLIIDDKETKARAAQNTADSLIEDGHEIFVVGITEHVDHTLMRAVASKPEYYFEVTTYNDLTNHASLVSDAICNVSQ